VDARSHASPLNSITALRLHVVRQRVWAITRCNFISAHSTPRGVYACANLMCVRCKSGALNAKIDSQIRRWIAATASIKNGANRALSLLPKSTWLHFKALYLHRALPTHPTAVGEKIALSLIASYLKLPQFSHGQVLRLTFDFGHLLGALPECDCNALVFSPIFQRERRDWMYFIQLFFRLYLSLAEFSFHTKRNIKEPVDSPVWLCAGCRSLGRYRRSFHSLATVEAVCMYSLAK
jgi:hypothetical protein